MAKVKLRIRPSETYSAPNFLRVYTAPPDDRGTRLATIEHLSHSAANGKGREAWNCSTIVDGEPMSKEDAMFIARSYAVANSVPVIYEAHSDR